MEGAVEFFLLIIIPIIFLYFVGVRIPGLSWEGLNNEVLNNYFMTASILLGIPLVIDGAIILFGKIVNKE